MNEQDKQEFLSYLQQMEKRFDKMDNRFDALDNKFDTLGNTFNKGFSDVNTRIDRIGEKLETVQGQAAPKSPGRAAGMTADEMLKAIENMDYDERMKLLEELGYKYFGNKRYTVEEIRQLNYEAFHGEDAAEADDY
jgi:tetrahydromethanopterin S-methyltransferase subunit G